MLDQVTVRSGRPAINVKYHGRNFYLASVELQKRGVPEGDAEKACDCIWESSCELFWEQAETEANEIFGERAEVYSDGRSGGWLVVEGIGSPEDWKAMLADPEEAEDARKILEQWETFEKWIRAEIEHLTSLKTILSEVEERELLEGYAEERRIDQIKDAAVELYEALETLLNDCNAVLSGDDMSGLSDAELFSAMRDTIRAALAKAEGKG